MRPEAQAIYDSLAERKQELEAVLWLESATERERAAAEDEIETIDLRLQELEEL